MREVEVTPREPSPVGIDQAQLPSWLLRGGLAFVFGYAALSTVLDPTIFANYAPSLFKRPGWTAVLLPAFVAYELLLAVAMLSRRHIFASSVLSALTLTAIVLVNIDAFNVLFRNVPIVCAAVALALQTRTSPTLAVPGVVNARGRQPHASAA